MFRENVLTQREIIDRIASTMVPVALDYQTLQDAKSPEAKLLLPLMTQRDQDQGVWIFAPDGKALGGFVGFGDMVGQTKDVIEGALKSFGPITPRRVEPVETDPYRGRGVMQDGSVCLAESVRTSDDALRFMDAKSPVISRVTLSATEFRAFAPGEPAVGSKWTIPEAVAKRLSRVTSPMCYQHAPEPGWVTGVLLDAEVRSIEGGVAWLGYQGRISSEHRVGNVVVSVQDTKLSGEGAYDVSNNCLRSVLLIGEGELRWPEDPEKRVTFDALVEWRRDAPGTVAE
jgi:hypothetical protein